MIATVQPQAKAGDTAQTAWLTCLIDTTTQVATDTVYITLLRTPASSPQSKCAGCYQQGHTDSKTLHQQNPPVRNWRCRLTQVDLYNGHKTVVVVGVVVDSTGSCKMLRV